MSTDVAYRAVDAPVVGSRRAGPARCAGAAWRLSGRCGTAKVQGLGGTAGVATLSVPGRVLRGLSGDLLGDRAR